MCARAKAFAWCFFWAWSWIKKNLPGVPIINKFMLDISLHGGDKK